MNLRANNWLIGLLIAISAHLGLAIGLGGTSGVKIERGGGEAGSLTVGSLVQSISGSAVAKPVADVTEAEQAQEVKEAKEVNEVAETPQSAEIIQVPHLTEIRPVEAEEPQAEPIEAKPVQEAEPVEEIEPVKTAPVMTASLQTEQIVPPKLSSVQDTSAQDNVPDAVLSPDPEELKDNKKPELAARPVIKTVEPVVEEAKTLKPVTKLNKAKAKKSRPMRRAGKKKARRGGKTDTKRGSTGGRKGRGGGGRRNALNGRALMSNYRGRVMAHMRRYKRYPAGAMRKGIRGTARVRFTISAKGRVISARLAASSGSSLLDGSARAAIRRASPFPPIPGGLGRRRMTFLVPIRFSM